MGTIRPDELSDAVMEGLKEYAALATDELKKAAKEAGQNAKKELKSTSPKRTGEYRKSWTYKQTGETSNTINVTVYSKNRYMLTHLLEYGHAKRGGGRVPPKPHIGEAQDNAERELLSKLERALKG